MKLKKEYNSKWAYRLGLCDGGIWYSQQAFRALNQAIGRCIRHKNDFGAILLLDGRYSEAGRLKDVSKWVSSAMRISNGFELMMDSVKSFFASNSQRMLKHETGPSLTTKPEAKASLPSQGVPDEDQDSKSNVASAQNVYLAGTRDCSLTQVRPHGPESTQQKCLTGFERLIEATKDRDIELFTCYIAEAGCIDRNRRDLVDQVSYANRCSRTIDLCVLLCRLPEDASWTAFGSVKTTQRICPPGCETGVTLYPPAWQHCFS